MTAPGQFHQALLPKRWHGLQKYSASTRMSSFRESTRLNADDIFVSQEGLDPSNVHSHLQIKIVDRTVTFVNGGFPVNFDGRVNCIPGRYIQPTPTMMVAAAIQAVEAMDDGQRGLIELDPVFCDWVRRAFEAELGDERDLSSGWDQVKTGS